MTRNILLIILSIVLSITMAEYFGKIYDYFIPQYSYGLFSIGTSNSIFITGFLFAYVFFSSFILFTFGMSNKNKWVIWSLSPFLILWVLVDFNHIYIPLILLLISYLLAKGINQLKLHQGSV